MALSCTNRGSGNDNTSALTFTATPTSNFTGGTMAVLCVAADNSVSGGATNNITSVTDSHGNTWTLRRAPIFDNGATSAGVQGLIATTMQDKGVLTTGSTITTTFADATTAKTWTLTQVASAAGTKVAFVTGADSAGQTTATPTVTSGSITSGDVIIAASFVEAGTTMTLSTDDTDSTNGLWGNTSVSQYNEIGTTTSGSVITSNFKVTTGTGTQTYNLTYSISSDIIMSWIQLRETAIIIRDMIGMGNIPYLR